MSQHPADNVRPDFCVVGGLSPSLSWEDSFAEVERNERVLAARIKNDARRAHDRERRRLKKQG